MALIVGVAAVLVVILGVSLLNDPPAEEAGEQAAVTTAPADEQPTTVPATSAPAPRLELGDGIYEVGREIQAGTYSTAAGDRPCYWARLRSFGQADSIIDEDNLEPGETQRVRVEPSDRGFKVSNGCTWHPVL